MYRESTAKDWKRNLNLDDSYKVDAVVVFGSGYKKKQYEVLDEVLESLEKNHDILIEQLEDEFFRGIKVIVIDGKRIWFDLVYGGAYLSELLHIGCLLGSQINLFLGCIGGLQQGLKSGDFVVPTFSVGEESSTKYYSRSTVSNCQFPDKKLTEDMFSQADPKYNPQKGSLVTCQAMLGETWEDIKTWSKQGYIGVEMETATFFAVSNYFHTPSSALLYIADNLIEKETILSASYQNQKDIRDEVLRHNYNLAFNTLLQRLGLIDKE